MRSDRRLVAAGMRDVVGVVGGIAAEAAEAKRAADEAKRAADENGGAEVSACYDVLLFSYAAEAACLSMCSVCVLLRLMRLNEQLMRRTERQR